VQCNIVHWGPIRPGRAFAPKKELAVIVKLRVPSLVFFVLLSTACAAAAQTAGPDEAVGANGGITQQVSLTPAQKNAIYNAVARQKLPAASRGIMPIVGTPVLPSVPLSDFPSSAVIGGNEVGFLKYAMVEDDVVVVDPIRMRVIDVIHGGVIP
jgi:hypothetical protein